MTMRRRPRRVGVKPGEITVYRDADKAALETTVSRETIEKFEIFATLLKRWNRTINLVSPTTIDTMWTRHILDSTQIFQDCQYRCNDGLFDLGSGAGFPGMILAIMGRRHVHLLESDQRKCTFLRTVARETDTQVAIENMRIADFHPQIPCGVITARAFASVSKIFTLTGHLRDEKTAYILNKGAQFANELTEAERFWKMMHQQRPSVTDPHANILLIRQVQPLS